MKLKRFSAALLLLYLFVFASTVYASDIYDSEPSFSPYYSGTVNISVLHEALQEVNYIRWLMGVPNNVVLNEGYTRKAQHGAVLLDAIDTLTHTPSRPSDMSETFYNLAYDATTHGNIAVSKIYRGSEVTGNMTLSYSTKLYMYDSDEDNIANLGHRRWLMNPRMTKIGFGLSTRRGYAVTYVIEEFDNPSRTLSPDEYARYLAWLRWPISDDYITWPASKHLHPLTYFDSETAWSVTLNRDVFDTANAARVVVTLTRQSDGKVWTFGGSGNGGFFNVTEANVAYDQCIVFRPSGIGSYNSGETWRVNISGLTRKNGGAGSISYTVQFTDASTGYEDDSTPITRNTSSSNNDDGSGGCNSGLGMFVAVSVLGIPRAAKYMRVGQYTNLFTGGFLS